MRSSNTSKTKRTVTPIVFYLLAKVGRKIGITKFFAVKVLNQDEILESLENPNVCSNFANENINGIVEIIPSVTMS